jgi:hypothetical protein
MKWIYNTFPQERLNNMQGTIRHDYHVPLKKKKYIYVFCR